MGGPKLSIHYFDICQGNADFGGISFVQMRHKYRILLVPGNEIVRQCASAKSRSNLCHLQIPFCS